MPFNQLQRRDSWPPTVLRLHDEDHDDEDFDLSDMDENPFSFFLTSPEDLDDSDEDLSAGIETSSSFKPTIREVSPSSLQRVPLPESSSDEDDDPALEMPLTLRTFTLLHTSGRKSRTGHHKSLGTGLGISIPENVALRGRSRVKLSPTRSGHGRGSGRTRARSLGARRPQSWRLPSPDIWSIEEEREDDAGNEGTSNGGEVTESPLPTIHVTEPSPTEEPAKELPSPPKKKKRVHWSF
ncbi:uncharacterized protein BP5553_10410 [Venustampulla echinocandica]|uniref:Uncharacterized protein n=1 Tax=Venustampulla echinocandica TaxID=2656787 RepID=A0A370T989_9HELO|nr:uncharacterized protein BP5553_10410 [Venustampulla echinocandica]RDL30132.1 hypothetical protein BP5553_10410 [Venustampulla echinocandica]